MDHLLNVANLARQFAQRISAQEWGELLGRWHDLGKYQQRFQDYLHLANGFEAHLETLETKTTGKVDHSTPGAQFADKIFCESNQPVVGRILAYCIAGHHAGLPDWTDPFGQSGLTDRLTKLTDSIAAAPDEILATVTPSFPALDFSKKSKAEVAFQISFFVRVLFSCLVDADFLATEAFMDKQRSVLRKTNYPTLDTMGRHLEQHLVELAAQGDPGEVASCRQEILAACRRSATKPPGLFSLSVPTGGGKTLSSLAFALDHIIANPEHGFERVIYAIPFTSIIEQTANVFRDVFDDLNTETVLEHHSNLDPDQETVQQRLLAENWDAPLIVTTNAQFFESLFAAKPSRCRKLHRLVKSVIILDEAQTLPVELLKPCLSALQTLANDYGCTIVLCTATQPAITYRDDFSIGLNDVEEMIPDHENLYHRMQRVEARYIGVVSDEELTRRLKDHDQFLTIVNTRRHAAELFSSIREQTPTLEQDGLFHLSTMMCGSHRAEVIQTIRQRLSQNLPCKVVSTQLIEAGVDVDFPVVYRALSGLDSIAQAAGRCNREGKRPKGHIYVFQPPHIKLPGLLKSTAASAQEILPDFDDFLSLEAIQSYFELHYWKQSDIWDHHNILGQFIDPIKQVYQFRKAAQLFRMIEDKAQTVIAPFGKTGRELIDSLMDKNPPDRTIRRRLQRYTVPVYENIFNGLVGKDIEIRHEAYAVLLNESMYDAQLGFRPDLEGYLEPECSVF